MKWIETLFCGVALSAGFATLPMFAQPGGETAAEAVAQTTSVIGRVAIPDEIPEGINAEGLSLDDAVILLEGKYNHPRRPYPANWGDITPDERRAWHEAFEKSDEGEEYARRVEEVRAARPRFTAEIAEDGSFRFEEIPLSWYQLSVTIMHPDSEGPLSYELARAYVQRQFFVKNADAPHNAGALTLDLKNVLMPGDAAPNWTATAYDGSEIQLTDFRGRYVLVDFWATWCGPCIAEMPNVAAVYEDFGGEQFEVISLSKDQTIDLPQAFHKQNPSAYVHGFLGAGDESERVSLAYGIRSIPSVWLIGPDGTIIARDLRGDALREAVRRAVEGEDETATD